MKEYMSGTLFSLLDTYVKVTVIRVMYELATSWIQA